MPLNVPSDQYAHTPWGSIEYFGKRKVEEIQERLSSVVGSTDNDEILDALMEFSGRAGDLQTIVENFGSFSEAERNLFRGLHDVVFVETFGQGDDLYGLVFLGELYGATEQISDPALRSECQCFLAAQISSFRVNISAFHSLGRYSGEDPLKALDDQILNLGVEEPGFRSQATWLLSGWKEQFNPMASIVELPERTPSSSEIVREARRLAEFQRFTSEMAEAMSPEGENNPAWFSPAETAAELLKGENALLCLNYLPFSDARNQEASKHFLRSLIELVDEPVDIVITPCSKLAQGVYDLRAESGATTTMDKIVELCGEYVTSRSEASPADFLGVKAGKDPTLDLLRFLKTLHRESDGEIGFQVQTDRLKTSNSFSLARSTSEQTDERSILFKEGRERTPSSDDSSYFISFFAALSGAFRCSQKHGTGPFGFSGVTSEALDRMNEIVREHHPELQRPIMKTREGIISHVKQHADEVVFHFKPEDEPEEFVPEMEEAPITGDLVTS